MEKVNMDLFVQLTFDSLLGYRSYVNPRANDGECEMIGGEG